jgi:hypothetical protein
MLPGLFNSSMVSREIGDREAGVARLIPLGRQGTPREIGQLPRQRDAVGIRQKVARAALGDLHVVA